MAKIHVHTAFRLNVDGEHREFAVGNHTVDDSTAEHWYVKAHADTPKEEKAKAAKAEAEAK